MGACKHLLTKNRTFMYELYNLFKIFLFEVPGGKSRCSYPQTTGFECTLVSRTCVLVQSDADTFQDSLCTSTIHAIGS